MEARIQGRRASTAVLITGNTPAQQAGSGLGEGTVLTLEPDAVTLLPGEGLLVEPRAVREDGTPILPGG